jgi:hypothetical protein
MGVGSLVRDWITYPDDPANCFAYPRAWDRFLVSIGLLPIYTSDLTKVGPILVDPNGNREYQDFYVLESGHLCLLTKVLSEPKVQEAARSSHEEQWLQVQ